MTEIKAIVTSESCPHCHSIQEYLKQKGLMDKVKVIKFETPEGRDFCVRNNIASVPECVVLAGEKGEQVRVCSQREFEKLLQEGC